MLTELDTTQFMAMILGLAPWSFIGLDWKLLSNTFLILEPQGIFCRSTRVLKGETY